jgi:uncharacterized iron-regulated protein
MKIGDAVLNFTAETDQLDKTMNALFDRIERTVKAAREAWNRKEESRQEQTLDVIFKDGSHGRIRAWRDDEGNYHDAWTNEVVMRYIPPAL